jgi:hypothetical protein
MKHKLIIVNTAIDEGLPTLTGNIKTDEGIMKGVRAETTLSDGENVIIGRGEDCFGRFPLSMIASKKHGTFESRKGVLYYTDHSEEGTYVNDKLVKEQEIALSHNDKLRVGKCEFYLSSKRDPLINWKPSLATRKFVRTLATACAISYPVLVGANITIHNYESHRGKRLSQQISPLNKKLSKDWEQYSREHQERIFDSRILKPFSFLSEPIMMR